jgi:hypothetical protein
MHCATHHYDNTIREEDYEGNFCKGVFEGLESSSPHRCAFFSRSLICLYLPRSRDIIGAPFLSSLLTNLQHLPSPTQSLPRPTTTLQSALACRLGQAPLGPECGNCRHGACTVVEMRLGRRIRP